MRLVARLAGHRGPALYWPLARFGAVIGLRPDTLRPSHGAGGVEGRKGGRGMRGVTLLLAWRGAGRAGGAARRRRRARAPQAGGCGAGPPERTKVRTIRPSGRQSA